MFSGSGSKAPTARELSDTALEADRKTTVEGYEITKAVVTWEMKNDTVHETK